MAAIKENGEWVVKSGDVIYEKGFESPSDAQDFITEEETQEDLYVEFQPA